MKKLFGVILQVCFFMPLVLVYSHSLGYLKQPREMLLVWLGIFIASAVVSFSSKIYYRIREQTAEGEVISIRPLTKEEMMEEDPLNSNLEATIRFNFEGLDYTIKRRMFALKKPSLNKLTMKVAVNATDPTASYIADSSQGFFISLLVLGFAVVAISWQLFRIIYSASAS